MEKLRVKDLMVPFDQYACIDEDATLYEAVLALEEAQTKQREKQYPIRAILVSNKAGEIIGKLSQLDILRSLEPKYSELMDLKKVSGFGLSSEFLKSVMEKFELWKSSLDDLCRKAAEVKVGSIVAAPLEGEFVDQDATLDKAVHQLIMGHHQSLLVASKDKIVGILRLADVYQEVSNRIKACKM